MNTGILEQINSSPVYYNTFTMEMLEKVLWDIQEKIRPSSKYIWYAINTVTYSGKKNNLESIKRSHSNAINNAKLLETIQGFKPKVKFKYKKDEGICFSRRHR